MTLEYRIGPLPVRPEVVRLDRYELLLRLGRGGLGQVFLARAAGAAGFERFFAVKTLNAEVKDDPSVSSALLREARVASRIDHKNVVSIIDVGIHNDEYYLVMEYVEGCTLAELCAHDPQYRPVSAIGPILLDALDGLHAAHELTDDLGMPMGLVHLDISPQNLLIGRDGSCRVADFGLARTGSLVSATHPGAIRGKPAYMAPEQITGEPIDRRTDVFTSGVVLWNALTGRRLFHGPSEPATVYNVLRRRIPRPSSVGLKPDNRLDRVVLKALQRRPEARFQSAAEMAAELRAVLLSSGHLGSSKDVASWVASSFGDVMDERRRSIRRLVVASRKLSTRVETSDEWHRLPLLSPPIAPEGGGEAHTPLTPLELRNGAQGLDTQEISSPYAGVPVSEAKDKHWDGLAPDWGDSRSRTPLRVRFAVLLLAGASLGIAGWLLWGEPSGSGPEPSTDAPESRVHPSERGAKGTGPEPPTSGTRGSQQSSSPARGTGVVERRSNPAPSMETTPGTRGAQPEQELLNPEEALLQNRRHRRGDGFRPQASEPRGQRARGGVGARQPPKEKAPSPAPSKAPSNVPRPPVSSQEARPHDVQPRTRSGQTGPDETEADAKPSSTDIDAVLELVPNPYR